jgi:hypothetical protein
MASTIFHTCFLYSASWPGRRRFIFLYESVAKKLSSSLDSTKGWLMSDSALKGGASQSRPFTKTITHYVIHASVVHGCCMQAMPKTCERVGITIKFSFMKKYLFGAGAIALAIIFAAFTQAETPAPQEDLYYFEFDHTQTGGYSVSNVENESNTYWKYIGKNLAVCTGDEEKACRVAVRGANVDNTTTPTELRNVVISAQMSSASKAIVTNITETGSQYGNQPD